MNDEWKSLFGGRILLRGAQYYEEHRVRNLEYHEDGLSAEVRGNSWYHVTIDVSRGYMSCTCPYHRQQGGYCKHMAAVLFAVERSQEGQDWFDMQQKKMLERRRDWENAVRDYVLHADIRVVQGMLIEALTNDWSLWVRFYLMTQEFGAQEDKRLQ